MWIYKSSFVIWIKIICVICKCCLIFCVRFSDCPRSNLFGENKHTMEADPDRSGIFWFSFGGTRNSLAEVQALIRPANWESVSEYGMCCPVFCEIHDLSQRSWYFLELKAQTELLYLICFCYSLFPLQSLILFLTLTRLKRPWTGTTWETSTFDMSAYSHFHWGQVFVKHALVFPHPQVWVCRREGIDRTDRWNIGNKLPVEWHVDCTVHFGAMPMYVNLGRFFQFMVKAIVSRHQMPHRSPTARRAQHGCRRIQRIPDPDRRGNVPDTFICNVHRGSPGIHHCRFLYPQAWTFKCKDGMKFETDVSQDSFEVECGEDDTFDPADYSTWPKCRASEPIFCEQCRCRK